MRIAPYLIALAIVVPAGLAQGLWSGRWVRAESFDARLAALRRVPLEFGGWTGEDVEPEARVFDRAGVAGGLMRRYQHRDGTSVSVMLVVGKPGPTSVHTPEVCYVGAGYEAASDRVPVAVPGRDDAFWAIDFRKQGTPTPEYLRIYHAWDAGRGWRASANPRADFAGTGSLYKLYAVRPMSRVGGSPGDDPSLGFLGEFLPLVAAAIPPPA